MNVKIDYEKVMREKKNKVEKGYEGIRFEVEV